MIIYY